MKAQDCFGGRFQRRVLIWGVRASIRYTVQLYEQVEEK
jgi:hypothetical protein